MIKKLTLIATLLFTATFLNAQTGPTKSQELGVTFSNFDSFGFTYRVGKENNLWRFSTGLFSVDTRTEEVNNEKTDTNTIRFGFEAGKEFRKPIAEKLDLRYGLELGLNLAHSAIEYDDDRKTKHNAYTPKLNFVFGANYQIQEQILIGFEVLPYVGYTMNKSTTTYFDGSETSNKSNVFEYGVSSTSARLSLVYRFQK
ncbi:hypothetical protein [Roseivirga pacifica]|uniref:hypothetical protein n=1 Tax=Roseivirga pacifica TaxID=1267423 RepID=UPI0020955452|nr:hypothetical protein [Roseivirga pacifica]MCO6360233.1 hypothetical protein [Roseivirga pacifica]MCO6367604.1 hypothetical protein [Roseivirga pacifica]MCO6369864.1 hypothetical protein [Roseivirga pacifica]MCO6375261.1 hypothetical protein [Roseivirga pacifica]MCO6380519.1 hypothetical protein [Roseivirga pacifica]